MTTEAAGSPHRFDLLATTGGRRLLFAALYFSEGAPIGYVWWALPTRLRKAGVPIEQVTALSALLTTPWTLKFLWAPLVDSLRPRRLGLRAWIIGAQIAMGITLFPVAQIPVPEGYDLLLGFLLVHAFCAATQDISVDALAVASTPASERGSMSERLRKFRTTFFGMVRMPQTWMGFSIACLAGAGMEATGTVAGPMLVDHGFSKETIGQFFAAPAVLCMATGALVGGRLSDRSRSDLALATAICILALAVGGVGAAAALGPGAEWALIAMLSATYLCFGGFTAASYALYMEMTNPQLGGTQFSAFMGAVNLCSVWSAWVVGQLVARFDYGVALPAMAALSLLALPLLVVLHAFRTRWRSPEAPEIQGGERA